MQVKSANDLMPVGAATFSESHRDIIFRQYRYVLWRGAVKHWGEDFMDTRFCMFIGLNPSTATAEIDDPTIRRCITYAHTWGYTALCMTNIFAYRSTDPTKMKAHDAPIGHENDQWLVDCARRADVVVAAWGTHGAYRNRGAYVRKMLSEVTTLHYLRLTKEGHPQHPLYLPKTLTPQAWAA